MNKQVVPDRWYLIEQYFAGPGNPGWKECGRLAVKPEVTIGEITEEWYLYSKDSGPYRTFVPLGGDQSNADNNKLRLAYRGNYASFNAGDIPDGVYPSKIVAECHAR